MLLDEDVAEQLAAAEDERPKEKVRPRLTDWSPEAQLLSVVVDRLAEVTAVLIAVNSKNGKFTAPEPMPRPATALDDARARLLAKKRKADHDLLLRRLYPHRFTS